MAPRGMEGKATGDTYRVWVFLAQNSTGAGVGAGARSGAPRFHLG